MVITRINNNITALNATRNLNRSSKSLAQSLERLSSGLRINRAADDASGLSISERLRSQIRGLNRAIANAQDAINLVNTAEGALDETTAILQRVRELSVQAANSGGQDAAAIQFAQDEIDAAISEITRIGEQTQYSTRYLLNGDNGATATIAGTDVGANIVGGPASITLSEGTRFLSVTQNSAPAATFSVGSDGTNNSNAIVADVNSTTFDTGSYSLVVGNAQTAAAREQQTSAFTIAGSAMVAGDNFEDASFSGFDIDAGDEIRLSGTYADGTAASGVTLDIVAAAGADLNTDLKTGLGFTNALGNFMTDPQPVNLTGAAPGGTAQATASIVNGQFVLTDADADTSMTSVTVEVYDASAGAVAVTESMEVTTAGNPNQAVVSLGGGPAQQVQAGETYTLRGPDPRANDLTSPTPEIALQFGTDATATFSNGNDSLNITAGAYSAVLDGGETFNFQNGDQNVRITAGTGGGQFDAGEQVVLNFDSTVTAGTTTINVTSEALSFQIGANPEQNALIQIGNVTSTNLGFVSEYTVDSSLYKDDGSRVTSSDTGAVERTIQNLDVRTVEGANEAIRIVDQAISQVSAQRSALGAFTNRLESTVNNLGVASENLATSESRIRDADIAYETTQFTRNQILVSAGTSILAQANLAPQAVLQLLG
jgi:flagellin